MVEGNLWPRGKFFEAFGGMGFGKLSFVSSARRLSVRYDWAEAVNIIMDSCLDSFARILSSARVAKTVFRTAGVFD